MPGFGRKGNVLMLHSVEWKRGSRKRQKKHSGNSFPGYQEEKNFYPTI